MCEKEHRQLTINPLVLYGKREGGRERESEKEGERIVILLKE